MAKGKWKASVNPCRHGPGDSAMVTYHAELNQWDKSVDDGWSVSSPSYLTRATAVSKIERFAREHGMEVEWENG